MATNIFTISEKKPKWQRFWNEKLIWAEDDFDDDDDDFDDDDNDDDDVDDDNDNADDAAVK